jgi:hypothetical protein
MSADRLTRGSIIVSHFQETLERTRDDRKPVLRSKQCRRVGRLRAVATLSLKHTSKNCLSHRFSTVATRDHPRSTHRQAFSETRVHDGFQNAVAWVTSRMSIYIDQDGNFPVQCCVEAIGRLCPKLYIGIERAGVPSCFERPWSSRRHNCDDLGRLVFETHRPQSKNGGACDFRPHPHRSPPQSQRPKASAMDANDLVIHGGNLIRVP